MWKQNEKTENKITQVDETAIVCYFYFSFYFNSKFTRKLFWSVVPPPSAATTTRCPRARNLTGFISPGPPSQQGPLISPASVSRTLASTYLRPQCPVILQGRPPTPGSSLWPSCPTRLFPPGPLAPRLDTARGAETANLSAGRPSRRSSCRMESRDLREAFSVQEVYHYVHKVG